jgi:hypothetical protein
MFDDLTTTLDRAHARVSSAERDLLALVAEIDRQHAWHDDGARDTAHWLSMRYGISAWKADRWIVAGHALERLPRLSEALATGALGIDKTVELARFATPEREADLIRWGRGVSCATVRRRGELEARVTREQVIEPERDRRLSWWWSDEGRRLGLEGELPAAQGAIVVRALERMADSIPAMPGEEDAWSADARRADALVALASARIADDPDPDRATVVVHAQVDATTGELRCGELEDGPAIHRETVERLLCSARSQTVIEDRSGNVLGLGRMSREPSAWMVRQVRYRDRGCRFPGCGARRFTEAHHITWWSRGGRTDLDNLLLICSFHHRLVHEHGWGIERDSSGEVTWRRHDGTRYRAGPSPGISLSSTAGSSAAPSR